MVPGNCVLEILQILYRERFPGSPLLLFSAEPCGILLIWIPAFATDLVIAQKSVRNLTAAPIPSKMRIEIGCFYSPDMTIN